MNNNYVILGKFLFLFGVFLLSRVGYCDSVHGYDSLVKNWIDIENQVNTLNSEWHLKRKSMENYLSLLDEEAAALKRIVEQNSGLIGEVEAERLDLVQQKNEMEKSQSALEAKVRQSLLSIKDLAFQLPPPLNAEWNSRINELDVDLSSNSEKLDLIVDLLKKMNHFESRVVLHQASMKIETLDVQVKQVYMGVSQGWYSSDDGAFYGYGKPTSEGWKWWHMESASSELNQQLNPKDILAVINILENNSEAELVTLPVSVNDKLSLSQR
ncbi:DUF3450 family protein [Teredinibacter sp. KSP-S5-2]|uniref:DUF3450 family protein n=1 Tax=Teredinibacter sp. KSP-S5-2 TaxID=3034506 RepID=UPI002934598A|nr:DUF3450 family protein [Teredinibacter sp. KSP-S5-2]WNO10331.1 DUF3450 family protein [Teredinibacter sp. KSP-S5-2]